MDNVKKYGLKEQVALLPLSPGVYQFLDKNGTIIYVGKAKSLRKRVSSYFMQNKEHSAKVQVLVRRTAPSFARWSRRSPTSAISSWTAKPTPCCSKIR